MADNTNMLEVIEEIKGASDEELKEFIEEWLEKTRMDGIKIGAYMVSAAVMGAIEKNLKSGLASSHRDFKRAIKRVIEIVSVQLKQDTIQNDSEEVVEEATDDRTAE